MIMMTDLEFVLRRLHNIATGNKPDAERLLMIRKLIEEWAEEISFKLDD